MEEPFAALDEITRDRLEDELIPIWRETGTTILFVTHGVHEAADLGREVMVLAADPGRVREIVPARSPEPRRLAMRDEPEFGRIAGRLQAALESCRCTAAPTSPGPRSPRPTLRAARPVHRQRRPRPGR